MGFMSIWHWLIVALIVVLIFGTGKLKNVGKDLGQAVHDFKESMDGKTSEEEKKTETKQITEKTSTQESAEKPQVQATQENQENANKS